MKGKVIKKLMAYLLVGAMVISTPITASATETSIADVYTSTEDTDKGSGSGSLSASQTGSEKFNEELNKDGVEAQVLGLALDRDSLSLEANGKEDLKSGRIQARVLFTEYDPEDEAMVLAADAKTKEFISKYLRWEVLGNEENVVGISYYTDVDGTIDHSMINVNAKNGGVVTIRAFFDINGDKICQGDDFKEFSATATVSVKQFAEDLNWVVPEENFYVNWKYDLNNYVELIPSTASDDVSFYATGANAKKVTISDDGVMTVKKAATGDKVTINATIENGKSKSTEITIDPGVPAKKVEFIKGKNAVLDHGTVKLTEDLEVKLTPKTSGTVTDLVEWSAKPNVVTFIPVEDDNQNNQKVKISIKNGVNGPVGAVTITAKATSGKKATAKVTINSTPQDITVDPVVSWTGKKPSVKVTPLDKDGNAIPTGKTAYTFTVSATDDTQNPKNITINKSKGLLKFPTLLVKGSGKSKELVGTDTAKVDVVVAKANGKKFTGSVKRSSTITVKQADIDNITVFNTTYATEKPVLNLGDTKVTEPVDGAKYKITVGSKYQYVAKAQKDGKAVPELDDAVDWASSSAKVGTITESGLFTALKGGSTKLTASYVTITDKTKMKAKLNKKTITIKPIQKAESLTLNKNVFVIVAGTNKAKAVINVKKQLPKGSKDTITWKRIDGDADGNMLTPDGQKITSMAQLGSSQNIGTGNKIQVDIPTTVPAGRVIKIGAYADGGAVAYAYIYVVDSKTKSVQLFNGSKKTTKESLKVGGTVKLGIQATKANADKDEYRPHEYVKENKGYIEDPVTCSFSKAGIASISYNENGESIITGLKPGTTKLTVKTLSGKKATVTIKVTEE